MHKYDVFMLIVVALAILRGAWKGMAWQLSSLASLVLSFLVAVALSPKIAHHFGAEEPWNRFLAMLVLFLGVSLVVWVLHRRVAEYIEKVKLQDFDRQAGAVFGGVKGIVLGLVITFFAVTLSAEARSEILQSRSGYCAAWIMDRAHAIMPEEVHDVLEPYIHSLDDALPPAATTAHGEMPSERR